MTTVITLMRTIAEDAAGASRLVASEPALATARLEAGATRQQAKEFFLDAIFHHVYAGDTPLHVAAAAYRTALVRKLVALGADVRAKNRRGAEPLHYAVDGNPTATTWNPRAQAATIAALLDAGADPNALAAGGVTPLHRAVRNRCAAAVRALLDGGADPRRKNDSGSTAMELTGVTTGRGGSGSPAAKAQRDEIVELLRQHSRPG